MAQENKLKKIARRLWWYIRGDHPVTRILSLVLALLLWVIITTTQNPMRNKVIPVEFGLIDLQTQALDDSDLIIADDLQEKLSGGVAVYFQVEHRNFGDLVRENVQVSVSFSGVKDADTYTLRINAQAPSVDTARVVRVEPSAVTVKIERKESKALPIDVVSEGELPEGYTLGDPVFTSPRSGRIDIKGPQSIVSSIVSARAVVGVEGATDEIAQAVEYQFLDASGAPVSTAQIDASVENVELSLPVYAYRTVAISPYTHEVYRGEPADFHQLSGEVTVTPGTVTVYAPADALDEGADFQLTPVDISGITQSRSESLKIPQPTGGYTDPQAVSVYFPVGQTTRAISFAARPIEVDGLPDGYRAEVSPGEVTVSIVGPRLVVNEITDDHVRVSINLGDLFLSGQIALGERFSLTNALQCSFGGLDVAGIEAPLYLGDGSVQLTDVTVTVTEE